MISPTLFPQTAKFCYIKTDFHEPDLQNYRELHPLEQALVSQSVDMRKAEFGDARWCAHHALHDLGVEASAPILRGNKGMPLWPEGVTGSVTHTKGFRAAVVAKTADVRCLGLDVEPAEPLPTDVIRLVVRPGEMAQLDRLRSEGVECADRVLFCAKEATYKSWSPLTHRWLGFEEAEIDVRSDGTFISYLLVRPTPVPFIEGRWTVADGFVLASTYVPAT